MRIGTTERDHLIAAAARFEALTDRISDALCSCPANVPGDPMFQLQQELRRAWSSLEFRIQEAIKSDDEAK